MSLPARMRWVTVFAAAALIIVTLVVGTRGTDDLGACAGIRRHVAGGSWRDGTLRVAGCRAWQHLHGDFSETR